MVKKKSGFKNSYVKGNPVPDPPKNKVSKTCHDCDSIFFGSSKEEAMTRLKKHKCSKK